MSRLNTLTTLVSAGYPVWYAYGISRGIIETRNGLLSTLRCVSSGHTPQISYEISMFAYTFLWDEFLNKNDNDDVTDEEFSKFKTKIKYYIKFYKTQLNPDKTLDEKRRNNLTQTSTKFLENTKIIITNGETSDDIINYINEMTLHTFQERITTMKSLLIKNSDKFTEPKTFYRVSTNEITKLNLFTSVSDDPYYCLFFAGENSDTTITNINLYKITVHEGVSYFTPCEHAFSEEYETVLVNNDDLKFESTKLNDEEEFWSSIELNSNYKFDLKQFKITYFESEVKQLSEK